VQTLMDDEQIVLEKYRRAKAMRFSTVEIHVQSGRMVHLNLTEKFRPEPTGVRLEEAENGSH
jgi:hypothetical protein